MNTEVTTNECNNDQFLSIKFSKNTDATTNEFYNEQVLSIKSGCYNERREILSADVARPCA
jgi:hypothetical protein